MMRFGWAGGFALASLMLTVSACQTGGVATAASSQTLTPVTIISARGRYVFKVEVARTAEEQERGLMFRPTIASDGGMIFPFAIPKAASFWMKNTQAPLDIIFIRPDGSIARIAENTIPYSLTPVTSSEPVKAVLEIAGGRAATLGIVEGDKVTWAE
jgi:uncharacterized protein